MYASPCPCCMVSLVKRAFTSCCGFFTLGCVVVSRALAVYGLILVYLSHMSKLVALYVLSNPCFLDESVAILNLALMGETLGDQPVGYLDTCLLYTSDAADDLL